MNIFKFYSFKRCVLARLPMRSIKSKIVLLFVDNYFFSVKDFMVLSWPSYFKLSLLWEDLWHIFIHLLGYLSLDLTEWIKAVNCNPHRNLLCLNSHQDHTESHSSNTHLEIKLFSFGWENIWCHQEFFKTLRFESHRVWTFLALSQYVFSAFWIKNKHTK